MPLTSPSRKPTPSSIALVVIVVAAAALVFVVIGSKGSPDGTTQRLAGHTTGTTLPADDSGPPPSTTATTTPSPALATTHRTSVQPANKQLRTFLTAHSTLPEDLRPFPARKAYPIAAPPGPLAPVYSRIPTTDTVIFIGIDDGLIRDPRVVQLLDEAHIPFSAFLVQSAATADPTYWTQVQHVGGTIESHTIHHPDLTKLGPTQQRTEICGTLDPYQAEFGRRPTLFRRPYGSYNDSVRAIAASCGFKALIMWDASTNPGRVDFQHGTIQPGDIFLMHWRTDLYDDLNNLLAIVHQNGYSIGRLEDYLSSGT